MKQEFDRNLAINYLPEQVKKKDTILMSSERIGEVLESDLGEKTIERILYLRGFYHVIKGGEKFWMLRKA